MKLYRNLLPAFVIVFAGLTVPFGYASGNKQHRAGERSHEIPVTMADLPPAARATLEKESAGGKVVSIDREMLSGQIVFSADVLLQAKAWDIVVSDNGKLISKELT